MKSRERSIHTRAALSRDNRNTSMAIPARNSSTRDNRCRSSNNNISTPHNNTRSSSPHRSNIGRSNNIHHNSAVSNILSNSINRRTSRNLGRRALTNRKDRLPVVHSKDLPSKLPCKICST